MIRHLCIVAINIAFLALSAADGHGKELQLPVTVKIFDAVTNTMQRIRAVVVVHLGREGVSPFRLVTLDGSVLCSGTREIVFQSRTSANGSASGSCFGIPATGLWFQQGWKLKAKWEYEGSWIEIN